MNKQTYQSKKTQQKKDFTLLETLKFWDMYLSSMVHQHESLMLSILLLPPAMIFYPQLILLPVAFIGYNFGMTIAYQYLASVLIILGVSTYLKHRIARPRPQLREGMTFKPMILRRRQTNQSMPSGDSMQAGGFLYYYLYSGSHENPLIMMVIVMTMVNVMLARVYFCCHFFSDTMIGFILGFLINHAILSVYIFE